MKKFLFALFLVCFFSAPLARAETAVNLNVSDLVPHTEISITPQTGTFAEGATFEVPIFINTKGRSVNAIDLNILFDKDRLSVVKPSGGKSIIGIWVQPPSY